VRHQSSRLGEIIRRQRALNRLTLRQFAAMAGISNPYLSQIERGLRTPSPEVVDAIARSLETTTAELYEEAGVSLKPERDGNDARARFTAVLEADRDLSPRQRRVLIDVYRRDPIASTLCERLVDLDEGIQEWRYRHVKMVQRTIGTKQGTGGSEGAAYLMTTLNKSLFPDLWAIRADL
jgi:tryptophan 2,3-dioxygenase